MALTRVGYLGPEGSFSHEAVSTLENVQTAPFETIADIFRAVNDGEIDRGLVPLENAIEGTVSATIDSLVFEYDLIIEREVVIPIRLNLLARPGVTREQLTSVHSYVHALAQVRTLLNDLGVPTVHSTSTSQAAKEVSESREPLAAVASPLAGEIFGLAVLEADIEDHHGNATRFVLIGKDEIAAPTGHDRTSIVAFQQADQPGSLYGILGRFAARDINLTKLESRPTKKGLGDYCFVIEFQGHVADDVVADCLADLQAHMGRIKFLGSYPVSGEVAEDRREEISKARQSAAEWISAIKNKIRS